MLDARLYREEIMEHYQSSIYRRKLENPDLKGSMVNPSCGDALTFELKLIDGSISEVGFQGSGCVISQATASLLSDYLMHKNLSVIKNMTHADIQQLVKIPLGPTRLRCALLSLQALHLLINNQK